MRQKRETCGKIYNGDKKLLFCCPVAGEDSNSIPERKTNNNINNQVLKIITNCTNDFCSCYLLLKCVCHAVEPAPYGISMVQNIQQWCRPKTATRGAAL